MLDLSREGSGAQGKGSVLVCLYVCSMESLPTMMLLTAVVTLDQMNLAFAPHRDFGLPEQKR